MLTRPEGVPDSHIAEALVAGWQLPVRQIEYAAVGYGSYHWRVDTGGARWFVTVDDLAHSRRDLAESVDQQLNRLTAALCTARALCDSGLGFVVAPVPTTSGSIIHRIDDRFAVALYPHVTGEHHEWGPYPTRDERLAVLDLIARIHTAPKTDRVTANTDDLWIPSRDRLDAALADRAWPWNSGPFAESARLLLDRHAEVLLRVIERYDVLAAVVTTRPERMVLTHGEPHRANTITTTHGVVLIDWDTALVAPPERDLWALADEDPRIVDDYTARTGVAVDRDALELYRLWWTLTEISIYIGDFRQRHSEDDDTRLAWKSLVGYLSRGLENLTP